MNISFYDSVYQATKAYLNENCIYNPNCLRAMPGNPQTPLVIVQEVGNSHAYASTRFEETTSTLQFEFDIYAKTLTINKKRHESIDVAREIARQIDCVMAGFRCRRIYSRPTPNVDREIYRIVARYQGQVIDNR